jgi:hypothetical protein
MPLFQCRRVSGKEDKVREWGNCFKPQVPFRHALWHTRPGRWTATCAVASRFEVFEAVAPK